MGLLNDNIAIITGAGAGTGRAHALLFAEQGASVLANDTGASLSGVGSSDAADQVVAEIKANGGKAVACHESVGSFEGAANIIRAAVAFVQAAQQMVAQGRGGRIINTSSSSGLLGNLVQINYGAAKAGIHMITRIASMELAR